MKKFQTPEVELIKFAMVDVIATSGDATEPTDDPFGNLNTAGMGNCLDL